MSEKTQVLNSSLVIARAAVVRSQSFIACLDMIDAGERGCAGDWLVAICCIVASVGSFRSGTDRLIDNALLDKQKLQAIKDVI